jgi:hypothetical protein
LPGSTADVSVPIPVIDLLRARFAIGRVFELDSGKLADEARYDGIFVLRTNAHITPLQAVLRYRDLIVSPKTVVKGRKHRSVTDLPSAPKEPKSTVLSVDDETIIVAFRRHTDAAAGQLPVLLREKPDRHVLSAQLARRPYARGEVWRISRHRSGACDRAPHYPP